MTCKELIEYLTRFDPEEPVGFVVIDLENRIHYSLGGCKLINDIPAIFLETTGAGPLDEILEER